MNLRNDIANYVNICVLKRNFLGIVFIWLRKFGITQFIRKIWDLCIYKREQKTPSEEMLYCKNFFDEHKKEVSDNLLMLEDEESKDVYMKMINFRCSHNFKNFPNYSLRNQYFDEIVPKRNDFVYADVGGYDGDTIKGFLKFCNNQYKAIYCFEPDPENLIALRKNLKKILIKNQKLINIIPFGLWDEKTTLSFTHAEVSSRVCDDGDIKIPVTTMDSEPCCKNVSFIKMDIEGAEMKALKGAIETIKRNKPILAICIYHSNEDMINIIPWVAKLNLGYKLYIRQYMFDIHETVLYAIPSL